MTSNQITKRNTPHVRKHNYCLPQISYSITLCHHSSYKYIPKDLKEYALACFILVIFSTGGKKKNRYAATYKRFNNEASERQACDRKF